MGKLILASNRGPVSIQEVNGKQEYSRGAGGLITALMSIASHKHALWFCSPFNETERKLSLDRGPVPLPEEMDFKGELYFIPVSDDVFQSAYNRISNSLLWFTNHYLFDLAVEPDLTAEELSAWKDGYVRLNRLFADRLAEHAAAGDWIFLHDYHLLLTPALLRERGCEALISHFVHTPWPQPDYMKILTEKIYRPILEGLLGADLIGMQSSKFAKNFLWCCDELLGAKVDWNNSSVLWNGKSSLVREFPVHVQPDDLLKEASSETVKRQSKALEKRFAGKKVILRIDRMDPTKNAIRGFKAYELLLERNPDLKGEVVFLALTHPSRSDLPSYQNYTESTKSICDSINKKYGTSGWQPVVLEMEDDFPRSLAAMRLYDVLLINPIFDGMNLVAKEGSLLNRNQGVLILSKNAGAFEELEAGCLGIDPFDIEGTAEAMAAGLGMDPEERRQRDGFLKSSVAANSIVKWIEDQQQQVIKSRTPELDRPTLARTT